MLDKFDNSMHNAGMSHAQQAQSKQHVCYVRAYAKINLTLDVLGKRPDGYHSLLTVMQTVDLHDTLCLTPTDDGQVRMICTRPELSNVENLAARAAQVVRERCVISQGVQIELRKRIPVAAGLGGGSSDAAAVLRAMQQWWQLPLTPTDLYEMAAELGSDVPFLLTGGLALCEGRGELVRPLPARWPPSLRWLLLLKPAIDVATGPVFRDLPVRDYTDGSHSRALVASLESGKQSEDFHNSLERGVLERYPEVAQAKAAMFAAGCTRVQLSGSGPTLFAPFPDLSGAMQARARLQKQGYDVYLSRPVFPSLDDITIL